MKNLFLTAVMMVTLAWTGSIHATPVTFDVDGPSDSYVTLSNIRTLGWTSIAATLADLDNVPDFTLNDNESRVLDFFTLSVTGTGLGSFSLAANLNFDTPDLNAYGSGSGGWGTFLGIFSGGIFQWFDDEQEFTVDGNVIRISMEDGFTIGCGASKTVHATVTNLGGASSPVPEPATLILIGSGLIGLAGFRRKTAKNKN